MVATLYLYRTKYIKNKKKKKRKENKNENK